MRNAAMSLVATATVAFVLGFSADTQADGITQRTVDICGNAYAILGWSPEVDEVVWEKVGFVMYTHKFWHITPELEKMVAQKATFRQYQVKGYEGAAAYVAHCGHGGTCNAIAEVYFRVYKRHGIPAVFCGPLPSILYNPVTPKIPEPDLTDYYSLPEDDWGDDDWDDDDWDDDDDDEISADDF